MSKYQFPVTSINANETKEKKSLESGNGTFLRSVAGYLQHGLTRRGYFFLLLPGKYFTQTLPDFPRTTFLVGLGQHKMGAHLFHFEQKWAMEKESPAAFASKPAELS